MLPKLLKVTFEEVHLKFILAVDMHIYSRVNSCLDTFNYFSTVAELPFLKTPSSGRFTSVTFSKKCSSDVNQPISFEEQSQFFSLKCVFIMLC